jgi:hypothetical protein
MRCRATAFLLRSEGVWRKMMPIRIAPGALVGLSLAVVTMKPAAARHSFEAV